MTVRTPTSRVAAVTADPKQLPHLVKLAEDRSPVVLAAVRTALQRFGHGLKPALWELAETPTLSQRQAIQHLMEPQAAEALKKAWSTWREPVEDNAKLERALTLLSEFQSGLVYREPLPAMLDALAAEYRLKFPVADVRSLAEFLFTQKGIRGAHTDYYAPLNSDLAYAINEKRGLPLTLAMLYLLVGWRVGLDIRGCNFPGHFLALVRMGGKPWLVDCFESGRFLDEDALVAQQADVTMEFIVKLEADSSAMVQRVLRNLVEAFDRSGDEQARDLIARLGGMRIAADEVDEIE